MKFIGLILLALIGSLDAHTQEQKYTIENGRYIVEADVHQISVITKESPKNKRILKPRIEVIQSFNDPLMAERKSDNDLSPQVAWNNPEDLETVPEFKTDEQAPLVFYKNTGREANFYKTGTHNTLQAVSIDLIEGALVFRFSEDPSYESFLMISLPKGNEPLLIETQIDVKQKGYYSVGFTGIDSKEPTKLEFLYQPLIWTWKRFPNKSYLTSEKFATTAATFINDGELTEGIAVDPSEIPYRFATIENSRYGLLLRNQDGKARPTIYAPILGGENSLMDEGQSFTFKTRYVLQQGKWEEGVRHILRDIFEYDNERRNAAVTLNQTLDNIIAIAMNDESGGWIKELKGFDYVQDAIGAVKIVSAMHQLGTAMVTGNEDIYSQRALPTMAYIMSREKYLFTTDERQKIQSPSYHLKGPAAEIGELSGLFQMTKGQTYAFNAEMNRLFGKPRMLNLNTESGGGSWQEYLYRYRASGNLADLKKAQKGADEYIEHWNPFPSSFTNDPGLKDKNSAFFTDFAPKLYDLVELYEETGDEKYLEMSLVAARQMVLWTRSNPKAPDSIITVNEGGEVEGLIGKRYKINSYEPLPDYDNTTEIAEQKVKAWKTSLIGLPPEQPFTYGLGPIMLTPHAGWFLNLAYQSGDDLLKDAAYNAILGRYAGFPGYYHTSLYTNVYQSAGYAARDFWDIKYNAIFHNHIFPHITLLIDFLVNDALYRSNGKVDFPGVYAPGYAYLTSKVYGSKLGTVYGNDDVRLWLPANAIQSNTTAFNHLLGIDNNSLYVVLMNTFNKTVNTALRLNPDVIHWTPEKEYEVTVYYKNGRTEKSVFKNGMLDVGIDAGELVAYKIENLKVEVPLFQKMDSENINGGANSFLREENVVGFGTVTGMLFNTFPQFSDAYIFIDKTDKELKKVDLMYRIDSSEWKTIEDRSYPFEFDIHLKDPLSEIEFRLESTNLKGEIQQSKLYNLHNE